MQYMIIRRKRQTIRTILHRPNEFSRVSQGDSFDDIQNIVVESGNIADATAYGMLGKIETAEVEGNTQMSLTQYKVLNVFPLGDCPKEDGVKLNQLAEAGGMSLKDASDWASFGVEGGTPNPEGLI
jgi:hypothetical protein